VDGWKVEVSDSDKVKAAKRFPSRDAAVAAVRELIGPDRRYASVRYHADGAEQFPPSAPLWD
jgi:hypothetical protein